MSQIDNFSKTFDEVKKWGLNEQEKIKLNNLFKKLSKIEQENILKKYKNLKEEPEKSFFEGLKVNLNELKQDIEKVELKWGFDELKQNFENSEISKEFFGLTESYIDLKLEKSFSASDKDKIKLALLWEIESGFNLQAIWEWLMNKVLKPLKAKIDKLKSGDFDDSTSTKDIPWFSEIQSSMAEMFDKFWLELKVKELDEKIEKINLEKDSGEITDLNSVLTIINPDNASNINFNTIKKKTENIVKVLDTWRNTTKAVEEGLKKLPFGLWEAISNWIKNTIKEGWILWMILWFFFWKEFMNESAWNQKKSIKNLHTFSETDDFPLKDNIESEKLKDLEPKKLETFYKFIDSKKWVDSTTETFWQELLIWKTKNEEIKKLHKLLLNKDWKILAKDDDLDILIEKLNWLEELENKIKIKENEELAQSRKTEIKNTNKAIKTNSENISKINNDIIKVKETGEQAKKDLEQAKKDWDNEGEEQAKKDLLKAQETKKAKIIELKRQKEEAEELAKKLAKQEKIDLEKKQKSDFENSVNNIAKLPAEILYKWEKLILNIEWNNIILWENQYNISINTKYWDKFEKIEFINKNFILNKDKEWKWTPITKNQVIDLISQLINKWEFSLKWIKDHWSGKVPYELIIKKVKEQKLTKRS